MVDGTVALDLCCQTCGVLAMRVTTMRPRDPLQTPSDIPVDGPMTMDTDGIQTTAGTQHLWTAASEITGGIEAVTAAILAGDAEALMGLDREIVPFYCRDCAASYCEAHWTAWAVYDPDWPSWFEELRGRCPEGHERQIHD